MVGWMEDRDDYIMIRIVMIRSDDKNNPDDNDQKVCAGVEEEGDNQEAFVKTLANQTCKGDHNLHQTLI